MASNEDQIAYWNGPVAERWVRYQIEFDRTLGAFGRAALERLAPAVGERVLDVGCGAGTSTLELAERVAPGGAVVGVDISEPLLGRAQERIEGRAQGLAVELTLVLGDAAEQRFPRTFDAVFSRFGVMFFAEPAQAFRQIRKALVPGGRLGFVCWRQLADNAWAALPLSAARRVVPAPELAPDPRAPGPFAFAERAYVEQILGQAGFTRIALEPHDADVVLSTTGVDAAVDLTSRLGPASRLLGEQSDDVRERIIDEIRKDFAARVEGSRLALAGAAWLVTAHAP